MCVCVCVCIVIVISCISRQILYHWATWEVYIMFIFICIGISVLYTWLYIVNQPYFNKENKTVGNSLQLLFSFSFPSVLRGQGEVKKMSICKIAQSDSLEFEWLSKLT